MNKTPTRFTGFARALVVIQSHSFAMERMWLLNDIDRRSFIEQLQAGLNFGVLD